MIEKRSRLSIDIPLEERLWLKVLAASQHTSINDLVLSCIREHLPCKVTHIPNKKTAASLAKSDRETDSATFESPSEMFKYLGLPTTCLHQRSQKASKKTSKKRVVKKKIRL
ncbi:MAG: hypothetical protein WCT20_02745 [Candidatus Babeliales bacterium]|jgi:hypothetical protein